MKIGEKVILVFVFILLIPITSATTTQINIKTLPHHTIFVKVAEPTTQYRLIDPQPELKAKADSEGYASVSFDTTKYSKVTLYIQINNNDKKIMLEKFENQAVGQPLYIQVKPGEISTDYRELEKKCDSEHLELCLDEENCTAADSYWYNETCNKEAPPEPETQTEETTEENTSITGGAISDTSYSIPSLGKGIYYAIAIIVLAIIAILVIGGRILKKKRLDLPKPVTSPLKEVKTIEAKIANAERKIEEAQAEIRKIKSQDKITAAEMKVKEDMERLEKLKKGIDPDK